MCVCVCVCELSKDRKQTARGPSSRNENMTNNPLKLNDHLTIAFVFHFLRDMVYFVSRFTLIHTIYTIVSDAFDDKTPAYIY